MKLIISIILAIVVSIIVWLVSPWLFSWPDSVVPFSTLPVILGASLVTLLLLHVFIKFYGKPLGLLSEALILLIVGFGISSMMTKPPVNCPSSPVQAVVNCAFINDPIKIVQPYPVTVCTPDIVEWNLVARKQHTQITINSFVQVKGLNDPTPTGSTDLPFRETNNFSGTTPTPAGANYIGKITATTTANKMGYYKFKVTCKDPITGVVQSIDPMIWVPR